MVGPPPSSMYLTPPAIHPSCSLVVLVVTLTCPSFLSGLHAAQWRAAARTWCSDLKSCCQASIVQKFESKFIRPAVHLPSKNIQARRQPGFDCSGWVRWGRSDELEERAISRKALMQMDSPAVSCLGRLP